jgi:hypothetical protein
MQPVGTIELRLQDLQSNELMNAEFEHEGDVLTWLKERPAFVQVLGLATPGLPRELIERFKAATRPLDEAERELARKLDDQQRALVEKQMAAEEERARAVMEQHRASLRSADPNRPLSIAWTLEEGLRNAEPGDERPITKEAEAAVLAWIAERDTWVEERGLRVGEALLSVWPGPMPAAAEGNRVQRGGTFTPTLKKK